MSTDRFSSHLIELEELQPDDLVLCCNGTVVAVSVSLDDGVMPRIVCVIFLWSFDTDDAQMTQVADMLRLDDVPQILRIDLELIRRVVAEFERDYPDDTLLLVRNLDPSLLGITQLAVRQSLN